MKLANEFTVPAPVEQAWDVLLDLERVAPCLPGAQLEGGDGTEFTGQMAIKLGPVTSRYQGTVSIETADAKARRAVMRASARDSRGNGTAAATITTVMRAVGGGTLVSVETDIQISGPAAQFGRGVMQEVSGKLLGQFADCLAEEMETDAEAGGGGGGAPLAMGANEATPAESATGTTNGATPDVVDWAAAAIAAAPSRPGGYDETPVGRLPTGPAADSALAAAGGPRRARPARERRTAEVLDLGAASRGAVIKRALPAFAAAAAAVVGVLIIRSRSRR